MKEKEVRERLQRLGLTLEGVRKIYNQTVKQAKEAWLEGCIDESGWGRGIAPTFYAVIGYNPKYGLMKTCGFQYGHQDAQPAEWYNANTLSILDESERREAFLAGDYLYEDAHYQKTGQVYKKYKQEVAKEYPLNIKSFEQVVLEIIS